MYVGVCTYVDMYVCTYVFTYAYVCMFVRTYVCMHDCVCMYWKTTNTSGESPPPPELRSLDWPRKLHPRECNYGTWRNRSTLDKNCFPEALKHDLTKKAYTTFTTLTKRYKSRVGEKKLSLAQYSMEFCTAGHLIVIVDRVWQPWEFISHVLH